MRKVTSDIREAVPADLPQIRACARDAYEPYVARIGKPPAPMVADFEALVRKGRVHVATDGAGSLAGFIVFYTRDGHMHLENVAVARGHQGEGVGKRLIAFCEEAARTAGLGRIELYTNEKMTENFGLYRHLGYEETGRREEDGFNRVFFRKLLAGEPPQD